MLETTENNENLLKSIRNEEEIEILLEINQEEKIPQDKIYFFILIFEEKNKIKPISIEFEQENRPKNLDALLEALTDTLINQKKKCNLPVHPSYYFYKENPDHFSQIFFYSNLPYEINDHCILIGISQRGEKKDYIKHHLKCLLRYLQTFHSYQYMHAWFNQHEKSLLLAAGHEYYALIKNSDILVIKIDELDKGKYDIPKKESFELTVQCSTLNGKKQKTFRYLFHDESYKDFYTASKDHEIHLKTIIRIKMGLFEWLQEKKESGEDKPPYSLKIKEYEPEICIDIDDFEMIPEKKLSLTDQGVIKKIESLTFKKTLPYLKNKIQKELDTYENPNPSNLIISAIEESMKILETIDSLDSLQEAIIELEKIHNLQLKIASKQFKKIIEKIIDSLENHKHDWKEIESIKNLEHIALRYFLTKKETVISKKISDNPNIIKTYANIDPCSSLKQLMGEDDYENCVTNFFNPIITEIEENPIKLTSPKFDKKPKEQFNFPLFTKGKKRKFDEDFNNILSIDESSNDNNL